jgi:glycosyltransferase involved in cell wall biosynthesis
VVIQNWADGALIQPFPSENPLRQEWGLDGKFVVGYSGNLGRVHEYRTFLDAIARLEHRTAKFPSISWLFIGGGALHAPFKKELCARKLKSVLFKPHQPRSTLSQSLSVADVHLVSLKPELEGLCVPSKFYGAAAVGRPIIFVGDQNGEIAQVLRRNELGYVVSEGDGASLADRLVALAQNPALRYEMGARARQLCEKEFDKRIGIARWESLLTEGLI